MKYRGIDLHSNLPAATEPLKCPLSYTVNYRRLYNKRPMCGRFTQTTFDRYADYFNASAGVLLRPSYNNAPTYSLAAGPVSIVLASTFGRKLDAKSRVHG